MADDGTKAADGRSARADWFVLALLAVSLAVNVILGFAVMRMAGAAGQSAGAQASGPSVGSTLPPFSAERFGGQREQIAFSSERRPTLIYVFSPTCAWCARNLDNLKTVLSAAGSTHRVIGLSLSPDVEDYVKETQLAFPVYVNPSKDMFEAYGLGPTPLTLVVSPEGRVVKSWVGAYAGAMRKEVESYFGVQLPGMVRPVAQTTRKE